MTVPSPTSWNDESLVSSKQDSLGRVPYASAAAELIEETHSFDSSVVFGLSGPWGSGKTSLINMIAETLLDKYSRWTVARFTPWATSDISGLLGEFYAALSDALPRRRGKQARKALGTTMAIAAPALTAVPFVGAPGAEVAKLAARALESSRPWSEAFAATSRELRELKRPILVVVDDIDRLLSEELSTLLKVVRLLGRFPGVDYLLAYDDETLFRTLSPIVTTGGGRPERFMEKIVQYPLLVPPLLPHQQLERLNRGLAGLPRTAAADGEDDSRLSGLVDCFLTLLRTPRAVDRYIAQLQHHLPLVPENEIDDDDVKLLTLLRVSFPAVFNALPGYRRELVTGNTGKMVFGTSSSGVSYESFDIDPLLNLSPERDRATVQKLLASLFPEVRAAKQYDVYGSRTGRGVANEQYFDRYFVMGVPDYDVSDALVGEALAAAGHGSSDQLRELLLDADKSRQLLVISKASAPAIQPISDEARIQLARTLAAVAGEISDEFRHFFGAQDQMLAWIARLILSLNADASAPVVSDLLDDLVSDVLRIRVWKYVQSGLRDHPAQSGPKWVAAVTDSLADRAVAGTLAHLVLGDDAPLDTGVGTQLHFALSCGRDDDLRHQIAGLLQSGQLDAATVASRIVSVRSLMGVKPKWELSPDFDQATFDLVMPAGESHLYSSAIEEVDVTDLSWRNRRRMASGRVRAPSRPQGPAAEAGD